MTIQSLSTNVFLTIVELRGSRRTILPFKRCREHLNTKPKSVSKKENNSTFMALEYKVKNKIHTDGNVMGQNGIVLKEINIYSSLAANIK